MSNKTSDKNVANIEEDVKIVKEFIDYAQGVIDDMEYERPVDVTVYQKDLTSMQNILAEREQMLKERDVANDSVIAHKFAVMQQQINEKDKRIQELEEESRKKSIELICYQEELENSIANLAELEQKDKRIQELEEENYIQKIQIYENSIPKQAVINKIEDLKLSGGSNGKDNIENLARELVIDILQEFLGGDSRNGRRN